MFKNFFYLSTFIFILAIAAPAFAGESAVISLTVTLTGNASPSAPTGVTESNLCSSIKVSWNANPESSVIGYNVYRSTSSGGPYFLTSNFIGETFYQDNDVVNGATYYYVVTAVDFDSNESPYSQEVSILKQELILQINAAPNPFSPDGDGIDDIAGINYQITGQADVFMEVLTTTGTLVKMLEPDPLKQPGTYTEYWDGTNNYEEIAGNDTYIIKITATDLNGGQDIKQTSLVLNSAANIVVISNLYDSPDAFTPNDNGQDDVVDIYYEISRDAVVSIKIYDDTGILIKTLKDNVSEFIGLNTAQWDGTEEGGILAPDGVYTYKIEAHDYYSGVANAQGTVNLDSTLLKVIVPVSLDNLSGNVTFTFESTGLINVDDFMLEYKNDAGVWECLNATAQKTADNLWTIEWDMSNLVNGEYSFSCFVFFDSDRCEYSKWTPCSVRNPADISDNHPSSEIITPNDDLQHDTAEIFYTITNTPAYVSVTISDEASNIIKNIKSDVYEPQGTHSAAWDATNNSEITVNDGTYTYRIQADDGAGSIVQKEGTLLVVNNPFIMLEPVPDSIINYAEVILSAQVSPNIPNLVTVYMQAVNNNSQWFEEIGYAQNQTGDMWQAVWDTSALCPGDFKLRVEVLYYDSSWQLQSEIYSVNYALSNNNFIVNCGEFFDPFSPNENTFYDTTDISYELLSDADVTMEIFDENGELVRTLKASESETAGTYVVTWDGRHESGIVLPDATYRYSITATALDSSTSQAGGTVTIDNKILDLISPAQGAVLFSETGFTVKPTASFVNIGAVFLICEQLGLSQALSPNTDGAWRVDFNPNNYPFGDYIFYFKMEFSDNNAKNRYDITKDYSFTINNSGLTISNLEMIPNPFSPDQSGTWINLDTGEVFPNPAPGLMLDDETAITFDCASKGYFTINLKDQAENPPIEQIFYGLLTPNAQGKIEYVYEGKNIANNGDYIIEVIAAGSFQTLTQTLTVDKRPAISEISAAPNPFVVESPNHPGVPINIRFTISQNGYVDINIYSIETQELVKTLWQNNIVTKGVCLTSWDGMNDNLTPVSQGKYKAVINARSELGNAADPVTVVFIASGIGDVQESRDNINPYTGESVEISFGAYQDTLINLIIYNQSNIAVRNLLTNYSVSEGANVNVTWDGKDDNDIIVPDGLYHFIIKDAASGIELYNAVDTGNYAYNFDCAFTATSYQAGANYFSRLEYSLPYTGYITIRLRKDFFEGPVLRFLKNEEPEAEGEHIAFWDGRDEFNNLLEYGDYLVALWAYTVEDNAIVVKGGRPKVDNFGAANLRFRPQEDNPYKISTDYDTAGIYFTLSKDSNLTINIFNDNGILVRTLLDDFFLVQGQHNVTWDGKGNNLEKLREGIYRGVVQARSGENYSEPVILHIELDI